MERSFPRKTDALPNIFDFISEFLEQIRPDPEIRYFVEFSVEEIFTNIVKYGSSDASEVSIRLTHTPKRGVEIRLVDPDSEEFDLTQAKEVDITLPIEQRKVGGLGLHLVKKIADSVKYGYVDRNSIVTITKNFED